MICNVDRTWTLERQDIDGLNATVAKLLEERADSKISTFNTDRFVKHIYDLVLDGTKDVQKALAFARHVPTSMTLHDAIDSKVRIKLQPKGYTSTRVQELRDRFDNSLQEVVNWMNELAPKSSATAVAAGINALNNAELIQTEPVNEPGDIVSLENRDVFSNLPYSPLSTTGNEKKEGREWYYDFLKKMGQISSINGISNDGTVSYPGVDDGIRMVMVRGGVPEDQAYPDEQGKENLQASLDRTLHMVITDKDGNTLYFDNDYNVTTKENGKLVYFPIRKVPTPRMVNGKRVFDITEQEGKSIIPVESRVKAGEIESDVISEYQMAYEALQSAIDYINANPDQQVAIDITGFNRGTLDYNGNIKTPISDIKNLGGFSVATKGQKGRTYKYIVINNVAVNIPLVMNNYDLDTASKVADLILNPVYNSKGNLISNNQKLNVIKPYTRLGREGITIDANGVIRLGGEILDVNDLATAKKTLIDYLTRDIPTSKKDKDGNIVNIKNQFYFEYDLFKTQNEIHNFTLQLRPDGGFNYSFITVPYRDWVKNNANVPVVLDANGEIKEYNGYVTYRINIDAQRKFSKQTSSFGGSLPAVKKAVEPSVQESTTPDINDIPQSLKDAIASGIISPDKLYSVKKGGTVKQAVAKVTTGKTWFDNTTIKYKDADGNIVEKKFSEVMPYTALFNIVNSDGRILAEWTKNGITLFHGSTYDELYHEAWHGFTQMFLTPAQRQELYDGVKSLDADINYYDHTLGEWKKMKAADLDFTNADHILYAEEYLADAFKAYALDKKAVSKKFKNIFQKIWEALKALFSRTSKESITDPLSVGPIKQAFNNLYTGNLVDYTYNQANIQFKKLNSGITATDPIKGGINGMNIADSLLVINMLSTHISDFIDMANNGLFGSKTNAYTINTILDPKVKKVALRYAKEMMQKNLDAVQAKLEETTEDNFKGPLLKKAAVLSSAITNFGNIEDLSDNKDSGVLAFYNKRTNFLNLEAVLEDDEYDNVGQELDPEGKVVKEGKGRDGLSAGSGNEFSGFDRLPTIMLYIFGSVYERTVVDPNLSPDGFLKDKYGTKKTIPANTMYNFLSSLVEGITDPEEMYKKLELYSTRKLKDGSPDPKAQMVKQFLNKLGKPSENNTEMAENLWSYFYNAVRYDRVPGIQVTIEMKENGQVSTKVGNSDGAQKALNRFMEEAFTDPRRNPSSFIIREEGNNLKLDIEGLKKKYPSIKPLFTGDREKVAAALIEYINDWGFTITPTDEFVEKIIKTGFIEAFHNYVAKRYFELFDEGKVVDIRTLGKLMSDRGGTFNKLLNVEAQVNPKYTDHMIPNSNGDLVSERFNPSGIETMFYDVNSAPSYQAVVAQPHLAHLNVVRSPAVKASQNFKKMFGENRGNRVVSAESKTPVVFKFQSILGTQVVNIENEISSLVSGMSSAASDTETATMRDFFLVNLHGTTEAFRHADKNQAYIGRIEGGDPGNQYYVAPLLFTKLSGDTNQGRKQGNKIIVGYLAAEIERIRNVQKEYVVGENANDIIFSGKSGEYKTLKTEGSNFTMFDGILSKDLKEELLNNESLQTYEDVMKAMQTNVELAIKVEDEINAFMSRLIEEDRQAIDSIGFKPSDSIFSTLVRPFGKINTTDRYNAAIENYTYSSFIHKVEMQIMVYGELAQYNHSKDEHMKRIAAFFATGKLPRIDRVYNKIIQNKPGKYTQSEWYKNSGLPIPEEGLTEGTVLNTAVLEDPIEDSVYFDTMVDQFMLSKNWDLKDNEKRKIAEAKYKNYRDMKSGDAQGWMTFDAYRALERRLNNWSPYKESLYNDIMAGKTIDIETLQSFFPVKKMQYAGPLGTQNFSVSAFHKYSLMPLIPSMIKGTRLEKLHNKMASQGIAYTVLHSGSKLASIGKDGKLDLFYKNAKGQNDPAFENKDYTFSKNTIFLQYLKEQVITQDTAKGKIKFPTQPRKLIVSGLKTFGVPSDFMSDVKDDNARRTAWNKLKTEKSRIAASKNYELETTYIKAIDTVIKVATQKLRMELGYKDPNKRTASDKPNMNKLVEFIKTQFANRKELSEYDLDFIAVGSNGELVFPADLASNPSQIEKLISSLINKRVFDQLTNGEAFIQGSNVGFEKFAKPTEDDLINYGTGGLRFYVPGPDGRILPMQVKIAMSDKFKHLLELKDLDGKRIGTVDRLNDLIKNDEKWLNTGDHRKMITMTGVRIPTQGMNSIEAMEVAEFLPPEAGNIMIVPLEMVAKSGGDFDIDKLVTIIPVIKNNKGSIELSRPVKTRKLLKTIIDEKEVLQDELKTLREQFEKGPTLAFKESVYSKSFAELESKNGDNKLFILKSEVTPEMISELTPNTKGGKRIKGGEYFGIKILGDFYSHNTLTSEDGDPLDIIIVDTVEDAERQYQAYVAGGAKNFTGISKIKPGEKRKIIKQQLKDRRSKLEEKQKETKKAFEDNYVNDYYVGGSLDKYFNTMTSTQDEIDMLNDQLEEYYKTTSAYFETADKIKEKIRELNRQQDSYSPEAYQNDLMDSMIDIILRGDNYTNLTLPNDTSVYTGDTIGTLSPVEEFGKVNRTYRPLDKSPTNVLTNKFNTQKAAAIQAGKAGIGMSATGNTFFALFKSVGLTLNHINKVTKTSKRTKKTTKYEIVQKLRLNHNTLLDDNGNTVISVGHTYDADGINDISDTISQLMNGYLDVAKEAWIFDINASKELESELEFMIMAGVPVNNAVGLLSQPLVREYLRLVKQNTSPYDNVRKQSVTSPTFAKYNALKDIFAQIGIINSEDAVSTETLVTEAINILNSEGKENFTLEELRANKNKDLFSPESIQSFMHFVEVSYMTKGLQQLKRTLNVDTSRNNTVSQVYNAQNKIKALSNVFDSAGIDKLMKETVLNSFMLHDVFIDTVAAMLPLRASSVINNYIDNIIVNSDMDMDEKEKYQNSFISDLVSYIYANRSGVFNLNDTSYYGIGVNGSADISIQPILKFGAFFNQDTMTLDVDPVSINKDFDTGAFGTQGYGKGQLALLPKDTFSNYGNKGRTLYRAFVYERELLRAAIPYATINENREFRIFRQMRTRDLGLTSATDNLPMRYEEFIRNKALEAVSVDKALFRTSKADGIYSVADQFMELIANEPGLLNNYEVLNSLQLKVDRLSGMRFIAPSMKTKDGILITSYVTEMLELMNPAEVKSNDDGMNMFISEFFSKLQKTAFLQAGNNAASGLYMTNYFDQTAIAETMKEPLDKFLEAINDPMKAKAFLDDYRRKLDIKLMSGNKNAYVNYIINEALGLNVTTLSIKGSLIKKDPHWLKDEQMANASTKAIAKATTPKSPTYNSSTKAYLTALGGASTEFTSSDSVWVFGAGSWGASQENIQADFDNYYKPTIDTALASGVTTFNIGTASGIDTLATNYLKSKGFNVESQGDWNKLTKEENVDIEGPGPETKINIYAGTGENAELSNFAERPVKLGNETFRTPEGAYQAMKIWFTNATLLGTPASKENLEILEKLKTATGAQAKALGSKIEDLSKATWDRDSSGVMRNILKLSFEQNPDALAKLLATGNATLTHTQDKGKWGKEFPRLLMEVRNELKPTKVVSAVETKVISEPYGVVVAETNPGEIKTQEFVKLIQPQIKAQAYKENASGTANDMFMYGLRWTRKSGAKVPLNNKSYANGGLATTDAKAKDNYVYDTVDQNGNSLAPVSDLQPIIEEIQNALGIDMSNYDAVIGNIYLPGQNIATHRDTTESLSARNYPVVVYTIGNNSGIGIYEDKKNPGSPSFASDSRKEIPTKNGSIYTFGMDGKGRFELAHDTPKGVKRDQKFPPITLPDGRVVENYTITLTFRRAADLTPGMPTAPAKLTTTQPVSTPETARTIYAKLGNKTQSENVEIAGIGDLKDVTYSGKTFWSKVVPEAKAQFGDQIIVAYRGDKQKSFLENYTKGYPGVTIGNPFDWQVETGTRNEQGIKSTKRFIHWMITGDNMGVKDATEGYRQAIINDIKSGKLANRRIIYYEEKNYATHATAIDYLINQYDWNQSVAQAPSDTEVGGDTSRFSALVSPMTTLTTVVDYSTGETKDAALVYDQSRFMKGSTYNLSIEDVETIFSENPDSVFIFDNTYPTASGVVDSTPRSNTETAWRKGLPTGNSFGINTRTISGITPTDENYSKAKDILDAQIDELVRMRDLGKKIVFPSMGVGQNLMGLYIDNNGKYARGNTVPAPSLFVYLSKRLLEEFGYTNPTFSLIETKTLYDEGILGGKTGLEFVQGFYKEQGIQTTTDADVLEQIKYCKGLI